MASPRPRHVALVIFVAAGLYLLGNAEVSLWDRDEPRYAQTSRQMLQSGDWVAPRFLDKVRTAKPVFIYWCQASAMAVLGEQGTTGVFAARLPSAVAMTIVLVVLSMVLWRAVGPERTYWTIFILASSALVIWSAKACTTDAVLLVGITVAQLCLYAIRRRRATWPIVIVLAVAISQAALTKGPVVLGILSMTLVTLGAMRLIDIWIERRRGPAFLPLPPGEGRGEGGVRGGNPSPVLKAFVAVAIIALLVGPWIYLVQQRESRFLGTSVAHDVLKRIAQPLEGHKGPPGYHLALIFATFFPWSLLLPLAVVLAWRNRADPQIRFALAAALGPWAMFEMVRTKLPHYMLPVFPPLAFLTADAIARCLRGEKDDLQRRGIVVGALVIGLVVVMLGVLTLLAARRFGEPVLTAAVLTGAAVVFAAAVVMRFHQRRPRQALLALGIGVAGIYAVLFGLYLPRADFLRLSMRTADILRAAGATGPGQSVMLDYKEPSLAFYQGGTIRENSSMVLSHELLDGSASWFVITGDVWQKTPPDVRDRTEPVGSATGLAYADGGRVVEVRVVRKR
jgi:4-amino-4-deoxy-L-arabinose transferase-like glycosyltransferase